MTKKGGGGSLPSLPPLVSFRFRFHLITSGCRSNKITIVSHPSVPLIVFANQGILLSKGIWIP